jgi:hypothetical protein
VLEVLGREKRFFTSLCRCEMPRTNSSEEFLIPPSMTFRITGKLFESRSQRKQNRAQNQGQRNMLV